MTRWTENIVSSFPSGFTTDGVIVTMNVPSIPERIKTGHVMARVQHNIINLNQYRKHHPKSRHPPLRHMFIRTGKSPGFTTLERETKMTLDEGIQRCRLLQGTRLISGDAAELRGDMFQPPSPTAV